MRWRFRVFAILWSWFISAVKVWKGMNIEEVTRFVTDLFIENMLYIYICKASHNVLRFA